MVSCNAFASLYAILSLKEAPIAFQVGQGSTITHPQVHAASQGLAEKADWRSKAKPIKEGSTYPAKEFCSHCGLCDTYYVAHVKDACAFLGDGGTSAHPYGG
jgi:hypothetical protein